MTDLCCCISCLSLNYLVRFAWLWYFPPSRLTQSKAVGKGGQIPPPPPLIEIEIGFSCLGYHSSLLRTFGFFATSP